MNPAIAKAIEHQNYEEAARLIAALPSENLWRQLYEGQLHEAQQAWDAAESIYRDLLRQGGSPKITLAARQGLQRLSEREIQEQAAAHDVQLQAAMAEPGHEQPGLLVLQPVQAEQKTELARELSRIMHCDAYSARMLLPSRGWRFYRSGTLAELQVFGQELQAAGIPVVWYPLTDIQQINVVQVSYFENLDDLVQAQVTAMGSDPQSFAFDGSEVVQRVEGLVPIFEEVVDRDRRGKLKRREETQDHAQFCDLHLLNRNCILRIYDTAYQFHQGIKLAAEPESMGSALDQGTSWANWRALMTRLNQQLPELPSWNEFDFFANTALDHPDTLNKLTSHINLFRRSDSLWDPAFHLYSSLVFLQAKYHATQPEPQVLQG